MISEPKEKIHDPKISSLDPKLEEYMINNLNRISSAKKELKKETVEKYPNSSVMLISDDEGELLKIFVMAMNAKKGLEIGTYTGYSTLCFGEGIAKDGKIITLDVSEWGGLAKKYWKIAGVDHKIEQVLGSAVDVLNKMIEDEKNLESFDFAFIDADKPNYFNYYEVCLKLIRKGGVIIIDNILFYGKILNKEEEMDKVVKGIYDIGKFVKNDDRVEIATIPVCDGMLFAYKK